MSLSDDTAGLLLVVLLVALVGLAVVVTVIGLRLAKLRRDYTAALDRNRREDLFAAVAHQRDEIGKLRKDVALVNENTETLRQLLRASVSRVGVVRYDAFEDMGGLLSFSAALLDEHGDEAPWPRLRRFTADHGHSAHHGESAHHFALGWPCLHLHVRTCARGSGEPSPRAGAVAHSRRLPTT